MSRRRPPAQQTPRDFPAAPSTGPGGLGDRAWQHIWPSSPRAEPGRSCWLPQTASRMPSRQGPGHLPSTQRTGKGMGAAGWWASLCRSVSFHRSTAPVISVRAEWETTWLGGHWRSQPEAFKVKLFLARCSFCEAGCSRGSQRNTPGCLWQALIHSPVSGGYAAVSLPSQEGRQSQGQVIGSAHPQGATAGDGAAGGTGDTWQ